MVGNAAMIPAYKQAIMSSVVLAVAASAQIPPQPSIITSGPYLQHATKTGITILWETREKASSVVEFGDQTPLASRIAGADDCDMHEVRIENLKPQTNYFYRVISRTTSGRESVSEVYSLQTAVEEQTPYAFGVVSDTQTNPPIWGKISMLLFAERPNFVVHAGDIVGEGPKKEQWTNDFLKPAHGLMSRVPIFAILGNHDQDHANYYRYICNPAPEHRYTFTYGNAQFFLIDTKRDVSPASEQYQWLDGELARSRATWKFAVHHFSPYSSDENDWGDTWKGQSPRGDLKLRPLVGLYEKHGLDICFFGHIHDYERTWPIREDKVDPTRGVIYVQAGGAGGGLEDYAPTRSWFTAKVHRDHHFLIVSICGKTLNLQAIDQNGILFDQLLLTK
ncbi:MAG: metallophosphoesterase family protein [Phycisphaerales bacterium]